MRQQFLRSASDAIEKHNEHNRTARLAFDTG